MHAAEGKERGARGGVGLMEGALLGVDGPLQSHLGPWRHAPGVLGHSCGACCLQSEIQRPHPQETKPLPHVSLVSVACLSIL